MMGTASHFLKTSNPEQDNGDRQLLSLIESIKHVVHDYNTTGIPRVPGKFRTNLKDRLILTLGTNSRRAVPSTNWRNDRARNVYLEVQDSNPHLFLAFLSVVSPTVCSTPNFQKIVSKLLSFDRQTPVELRLNTDAKDFFDSIAAEETLKDNPRYVEFVKALFPEGQDLTFEHEANNQDQLSRKRPRVSDPSFPTGTSKTGASPTESQSALARGPAQEKVIENASLEGVAKVFDKNICVAIRRVQVQTDSDKITSWKASVTMVFPLWGGPVDCLMSLDVCESDVEHLAMLLFDAQMKWVEQVRHIVLNEGITLIIPHSEATLKGVRDEAIIKVFGNDIYNAINESPVRKRESKEGKLRTECVSMILTKNGAIINLSLGLDRGLEIRDKLYT
ncbi:hypothetical protein V495_00870 [Pseudogymnoascus sp. VKM F-4514 (FW-929)]|nr:hypothetical protein V495_00870 [Pseudogymnoascus sp. VKM F-4514 (FW-929)]KFY67074.1 hypothetical protein V497_00566 [Pseudogymnoascus sp. VKM F-4516 (FW-969)]